MRKGRASTTAVIVAFWRALGDLGVTSVPGFRDPFAEQLLEGWFWRRMLARVKRRVADPNDQMIGGIRPHLDGMILRVAFIDKLLAERTEPQLVILGAGLDTRVYRLPALRDMRVFEVDHPASQAYKRSRVARLGPPLSQPVYVAVDFTRDDLLSALAAAGHNASLPTVWVWEGVTMYLDDVALRATLLTIQRASAPGSRLIAHYHEQTPGQRTGTTLMRWLVLNFWREPQIGLRSRAEMRARVEAAGFDVQQDAGVDEQAQQLSATAPDRPHARVSRIMVATPHAA